MDITTLDSRKAASVGKDLHLVHPATGELLYNDAPKNKEPCIAIVIGTESPAAQAAMREINRAKVKADKGKETDPQVNEDFHRVLVDIATPLVIGFKNVLKGDLQMTGADVPEFLNLQMATGIPGEVSFVEQVVNFATKRANFLAPAPTA